VCTLPHLSLFRRDKNSILFPEGADLCRGIYGSVQVPALSVDATGTTFFNVPQMDDDQKEMFPLLAEHSRLEELLLLNVSDVSTPYCNWIMREPGDGARSCSLLHLMMLDVHSFTSSSRTRARP